MAEDEAYKEKFVCKDNMTASFGIWEEIKTKNTEIETLRKESQEIRFEVETITHKYKFFETLCDTEHKSKKESFMELRNKTHRKLNKNNNNKNKIKNIKLSEVNHNNNKYHFNKYIRNKSRKMDEAEEEEENQEIKLCGAKCRHIPEDIKAKFVGTMFADYVRIQTAVALTWNLMSKYNEYGYKGKLVCIDVTKSLAIVESEINQVNNKIGKILSDIKKLTLEK